jgi:pyruvate,orthophosphate dikinase
MEQKDLLGGKGANLAEMTSVLGLPVPPGFTITTDACRAYLAGGWPSGLDDEVAKALRTIEREMGKTLGDPADPLLVSVRSGAKFSMPGMMDTVLNLGLNDESVAGLAAQTDDERFAYDSYRRFIAMYARIVLGVDGEEFDHLLEGAKKLDRVETDAALSARTLWRLCERYQDLVEQATGEPFPQDPMVQLRGAIEAVFRSWGGARAVAYRKREHIPEDLGTAVNVQAMVFGNRDNRSGTGVGFTRNASTGENKPYGDFLLNAQGEDVVAGIRKTEDLDALKRHFPEIHAQLLKIFDRLERHYRDMCDTEFTIEQDKLWMLQTRVGKRTGEAALRMAVEMTQQKGWKLTQREALTRVTADHLDQVLHPHFVAGNRKILTEGLPASPGAGVGQVCFDADAAVELAERGQPVILVRVETSPEDIHGMQVAEGILTVRGGLVSHAAVVARGWGIPAVVGAEAIHIADDHFTVGGVRVDAGDVLSLDGTTGEVILGAVPLEEPELSGDFGTILEWADRIRKGKLGVRANADTGPDAAKAVEFGAEGIGLCRTEHMFLAEDRLPIVRAMILADTPRAEARALERLRVAQKTDFLAILEAMEGRPVTIRLLDPPLHEFLPSVEDLRLRRAESGLTPEEADLLEAAEVWQEHNPMMGTRGVRLGVMKPGLYAMQVRALVDAARERVAAGDSPVIEIMIPLTISREELRLARSWVEGALAEALGGDGSGMRITIGTMVETPRAAVHADGLAEEADFFSFGTNDLTQMVFGFSRDDVEARLMPAYLEAGLLRTNPFETIDRVGVGELVALAAERGRAVNPRLKLGVCGEHGGDPESIDFFYTAGLDYVSCSPYRVPIARLAAAQAVIRHDEATRSAAPARRSSSAPAAKAGRKPSASPSKATKRKAPARTAKRAAKPTAE